MLAASRTVAVVGSAIGGFMIGGPIGAAAAGIAGGAAYDGVVTGIQSKIHHEYQPYGEIQAISNMVNGHHDAGDIFDFTAGIGFDALAGYGEGMGQGVASRLVDHPEKVVDVYRVVS